MTPPNELREALLKIHALVSKDNIHQRWCERCNEDVGSGKPHKDECLSRYILKIAEQALAAQTQSEYEFSRGYNMGYRHATIVEVPKAAPSERAQATVRVGVLECHLSGECDFWPDKDTVSNLSIGDHVVYATPTPLVRLNRYETAALELECTDRETGRLDSEKYANAIQDALLAQIVTSPVTSLDGQPGDHNPEPGKLVRLTEDEIKALPFTVSCTHIYYNEAVPDLDGCMQWANAIQDAFLQKNGVDE